MRQILYVSRCTARGGDADLEAIVECSRHNNALDGITGLLWSDGSRFLQVIEGPDESVAMALARIMEDPRHDHIEILSDRAIEQREFGGWSMGCRSRWDDADAFDARMRRDLSRCAKSVRDAFLDLVAVKADA